MDFLFKRTTGEKVQATLFLIMWGILSLYFGIEGYKHFSYPILWGFLLLFGFIVSIRQWNDSQVSIFLQEESFLWKTFSFTREIFYKEVIRIENNVDRNRIIFHLRNGKKYYIRLGDSYYGDFFPLFAKKDPTILDNLEVPKRIYLSLRYLFSILAIFLTPSLGVSLYMYNEGSIFSIALGIFILTCIFSFLLSTLIGMPIYYEFRESYIKGKFFLRKSLYIPYQDLEKAFISTDKKGFWRCSLIEKDSKIFKIAEMPMSLSLYLYFIFLREKTGFSKNA